MLGRKDEDFFHYSDFTKLLHPDDEPKAMEAMRQHIKGETDMYEVVYRIKHKKGNYVTVYDRGQIVEQRDGITRVAGIVIDASSIHASLGCKDTGYDHPGNS